jgi:hypothetical protein
MDDSGSTPPPNEESGSFEAVPMTQQNGATILILNSSDSNKDSPGSPIIDDKPSLPQNPEDLARLKRQ